MNSDACGIYFYKSRFLTRKHVPGYMCITCGNNQNSLQVSTVVLFLFNCCEKCLEVTSSKSLMILSLNYFNEECWSIL